MVEEEEFRMFYEAHESAYYNVALRWARSEDAAIDYVHDTMMEIWKKQNQISKDKWKAYGYSILLNKLRNSWRRKKVWNRIKLLMTTESEPTIEFDNHIINPALWTAFHDLSQEHREILVLTELSDLTYQEIAEIQGIPAGTVGSRRHTALENLRRRLGL